MRRRTHRNNQAGAAAVEYVLLLSFVLLVALPSIDLLGAACSARYDTLAHALGGGTQTTTAEGNQDNYSGGNALTWLGILE